jgi:ComF family protein
MFRALLAGLPRRIPSQCAVCHAWPAQPVCEDCVEQFGQPVARCGSCALAVPAGMRQCGACMAQPGALDAALAAVSYQYPWSGLVQGFKFRQQTGWARSVAALMRSAPWVEPALDAADLLLPMPLAPQRLRQRGFNQTLLLARALEPAKVRSDLLLRIRDTPAQSGLPRAARLESVKNAFAVDPLLAHRVQGRRVVVLDDVMTSGASLQAAARALRQAGAAHITGLVFARTERP